MTATTITSKSELIKAQIDVCNKLADALEIMNTSAPEDYIRGFADALEARLKEIANATA